MTKFYQFVKQIHRLLVLVIFIFVLAMSLTGAALKYTVTTLRLFPNLDLVQIRYIHNQLSPYFSVVLVVMALTGFSMYILPPLISRRAKKNQSKNNTPTTISHGD